MMEITIQDDEEFYARLRTLPRTADGRVMRLFVLEMVRKDKTGLMPHDFNIVLNLESDMKAVLSMSSCPFNCEHILEKALAIIKGELPK